MIKSALRLARTLLLALPLALVATCGAPTGVASTPAPLAPPTRAPSPSVVVQPTDTPNPTPSAAEQATRVAAQRLMLPVGGDLADFFIATISGQEAKARGFLAPGAYADVANLRDALGLPQSTGPYTIDTLPLSVTGDRATARTVIAYQERQFQEVVTLVKVEGRWKIEAVVPDRA